jgi:hypothetical protein
MAFERVKQFKDLELEYDMVSGGTLKVYTDMPGTPMALKRTMNIPVSVGTRTYVFPLDQATDGGILEGTLIKFRIESPGIVRLFGGVVRVRPIGTYFNGANGEIWETLELALGI